MDTDMIVELFKEKFKLVMSDEFVSDLNDLVEQIKTDAHGEGYDEGYEAGHGHGFDEGYEDGVHA